jgi:hypothetical protein
VRSLVDGQPPERPQFDDLCETGIDLLEPGESVIQGEHRNLIRFRGFGGLLERDSLSAVASFPCCSPPGVIDEDPAHHLRRNPIKVRSIPPVDAALVYQAQVRLVNERGRLQRMVCAFVSKLTVSDPAQLTVDDGQQTIEGASIAATPVVE